MKTPGWLAEETASHGEQLLTGSVMRSDAAAGITAAITSHPEYVADLIAADTERLLSGWLKENLVPVRSSQLSLFPEIPTRMRVAPGKSADVTLMDAHQLDMARRMLLARTRNQIDGAREAAEREQAAFEDFFGKVRPRMSAGETVGEVLERMRGAA